jgi:TfoX N-terminal domain
MAYDETLADRIRAAAAALDSDVTECKMFGGLAFMLNGHMFAGVVGKDAMLRLGEPAASHALSRPHVREMDFTGRPMKGMVFVEPNGLNGPALEQWITEAAAFVRSLPAKA